MLAGIALLAMLALAACAPGGRVGGGIIVGSKNDADGQLLAAMYALLLEQQGYQVTRRIPLGQTNVLDAAIKSGAIDLYPEFTGTALTLLNLPATQDGQRAYQQVKDAYQRQFQITWLAPAYGLNDGYGLCTSQANADRYHLRTLADLAPVASGLTIAQQQDAGPVLAPVATAYGIRFKSAVHMSEQLTFAAVQRGDAQVNACYTTDPAIAANHFVLLADPLGAFPVYNPAPIVRSQVLKQSPAIATALAPLAEHLTTETMSGLIKRVSSDHQPVEEVARSYLRQTGLLPPA